MRASTVFLVLGTLGAGVAIGDKLNPFGGNRVIATAPAEPAAVSLSSPNLRQAAPPVALSAEALRQEQEAKIKKALGLIDELAASDMEKNLAGALGGDSIGQQVARGLIAGRHQDIPGASEILRDFQAQLRADPKAGLDVVREAMRRIPEKGFESDRMTLLQMAATLPGMETDSRELALQELTSNVVEIPQPQSQPQDSNAGVIRASLVATAHRVFIDLTQDGDQAYAGTLQGILSQPDSAIRRTLIDKFIGKFPDRREALQQELASRQIDAYSVPGAQPPSGVVVQAQTEAPPEGTPPSADALAMPAAAPQPPVEEGQVAAENQHGLQLGEPSQAN